MLTVTDFNHPETIAELYATNLENCPVFEVLMPREQLALALAGASLVMGGAEDQPIACYSFSWGTSCVQVYQDPHIATNAFYICCNNAEALAQMGRVFGPFGKHVGYSNLLTEFSEKAYNSAIGQGFSGIERLHP
jgi:hypothetical protein